MKNIFVIGLSVVLYSVILQCTDNEIIIRENPKVGDTTFVCQKTNGTFLKDKVGYVRASSFPDTTKGYDFGVYFYDSLLNRCEMFYAAYVCNGFPDSLKGEPNYNQLVQFDANYKRVYYTDGVDTIANYPALDIKKIRKCSYNCLLDDQVRYTKMSTLPNAKLRSEAYIIQSEAEAQAFKDSTGYYPREAIDFQKQVLVGFCFASTGCAAFVFDERIEQKAANHYIYKYEDIQVCECRPVSHRLWWILVDRRSPNAKWEVQFTRRYLPM